MIDLIVNADDFGLSRGVNHGIVDAHKYGIVTSTTMLVNMPGASHAVELAKATPSLGVGIHLTLTCGRPILHVPSLMNEDGFFRLSSRDQDDKQIDLDEVEREWVAQIEKFASFGLEPTHMDSHHHVHGWEILQPIVARVSQKYQLPVRNLFEHSIAGMIPLTDWITCDFYGDHIDHQFFDRLIDHVENDSSVEVMTHPAYMDAYLQANSSYCEPRVKELEILTQVELNHVFTLVQMGRL
ncbi:chitin disaccharide deacetylase [Seinonella peptonophila]|uniref:chitin disaccharide deacetylase n=1 Tax=Seinonella peptonophila TaxID=112248 RepID=UPI00093275D1|nr:chitin disaccharide deacetylase [Seinonella peptonophila]